MAASQQGYKCEFIDSVPEDFYCKKCILVARRLVYTSCCEETYCHRFITDIQQQNKPCPACGKEEFSIVELKKYQKKVMQLQVYCSMKERGCVWSGTLDQLDTHLDPHLDNCQYVDTKCPLNCLQTIPKNKVDHHVAQECTKRPYVCQHCAFKATYEEVVDAHLPECKYVALQCPNMCGVSCDREVMEDHMKICRLEEVVCEFSSVGCDGRYNREDQDEHARQNSQKHITLTASLAVESKELLQQTLQEQNKKHKEEEDKLKLKIEQQERKLSIQEKKLAKLELKLGEQEHKLGEQEKRLNMLEQALQESKVEISDCGRSLGLNRRFVMKNFSYEKEKDRLHTWSSPYMYTHTYGYKFYVGVIANGSIQGCGKSVSVYVIQTDGEFDEKLRLPAKFQVTIELVNQHQGENVKHTSTVEWTKNRKITWFPRIQDGFIEHSKLGPFLADDTLLFHVSDIKRM